MLFLFPNYCFKTFSSSFIFSSLSSFWSSIFYFLNLSKSCCSCTNSSKVLLWLEAHLWEFFDISGWNLHSSIYSSWALSDFRFLFSWSSWCWAQSLIETSAKLIDFLDFLFLFWFLINNFLPGFPFVFVLTLTSICLFFFLLDFLSLIFIQRRHLILQ